MDISKVILPISVLLSCNILASYGFIGDRTTNTYTNTRNLYTLRNLEEKTFYSDKGSFQIANYPLTLGWVYIGFDKSNDLEAFIDQHNNYLLIQWYCRDTKDVISLTEEFLDAKNHLKNRLENILIDDTTKVDITNELQDLHLIVNGKDAISSGFTASFQSPSIRYGIDRKFTLIKVNNRIYSILLKYVSGISNLSKKEFRKLSHINYNALSFYYRILDNIKFK